MTREEHYAEAERILDAAAYQHDELKNMSATVHQHEIDRAAIRSLTDIAQVHALLASVIL
jgi:hypothetical protein